MALSDNKRLYDIATRKQIYIEGVKLQQAKEFNFVLYELKEELDKILSRVNYKTLDGLTKANLNKLIVSLRSSQSKIWSKYTEQLLEELKQFTTAEMEVSRRAFAFGKLELDDDEPTNDEPISDEEAQAVMRQTVAEDSDIIPFFGIAAATGSDKVWSSVINAPIPANGLYLVPFIKGFSISAQAGVENIIRKGYANGSTLQETIAAITGEEATQGTSSQLQRIAVQARAVIDTAYQHATGVASSAVQSALFGRYQWHSVMDGRTTDICAHRNGHVYRFGRGPLPPAHIKCRSHIAPIVGSSFAAETFHAWISRQPESVQDDILGNADSEALRAGKLRARDLTRFEQTRPLSLAEFRRKIRFILTR